MITLLVLVNKHHICLYYQQFLLSACRSSSGEKVWINLSSALRRLRSDDIPGCSATCALRLLLLHQVWDALPITKTLGTGEIY